MAYGLYLYKQIINQGDRVVRLEYHLGYKGIYSLTITDNDEIEVVTDTDQLKNLCI